MSIGHEQELKVLTRLTVQWTKRSTALEEVVVLL